MLRKTWLAPLGFCLAWLLAVGWQLWVPPYLGLADNGDFAKASGRYALAPAAPLEQETFHFFIRQWKVDMTRHWQSGYWGTAAPLLWLALKLSPEGIFDIRWLGLIYVAIGLLAVWQLGRAWGANWPPMALGVLVLADAAYVTYWQSFYFDAAAIACFFLLAAAWWRSAEVPGAFTIALMTLGGLGFALSKGPHALAAIALGFVLLCSRKKFWLLPAAVLLLAGAWNLSRVNRDYQAIAYYNLVFTKLGHQWPDALEALGVGQEYRHLLGTHAFASGSPAQNPVWLREFFPARGYWVALRYYATHPQVALAVMARDLRQEAPQIRAENLGNYEISAGKRYCTLSHGFSLWSDAKAKLFRLAPWHAVFFWGFGLWFGLRQPNLRFFSIGVALLGSIEFGLATLADAIETHRHLLFFHIATDWLVLIGFYSVTRRLFFR
jgi:hypothetical protein